MPEILEQSEAIRPFPDARSVLAPDQIALAQYLHPLVAIDLAAVAATWSGWIHLVSPVEPCAGLVGLNTRQFHNALLRPNGMGFQIEQARYRLGGDPRPFELASSAASGEGADEYLEPHHEREETSFQASPTCFLRHGEAGAVGRDGASAMRLGTPGSAG